MLRKFAQVLVIRKEQLEPFADLAVSRFEKTMIAHWGCIYPQWANTRGEDALCELA